MDLEKQPKTAQKFKKSTTEIRNINRSKSLNPHAKYKSKAQNEIQKDVDRTFQVEKYFKREDVKEMLHTILYKFTEKSSLKYVQGMNFIAGFILNHSLDYEYCFNIFMFIQGREWLIYFYFYETYNNREPRNAQFVPDDPAEWLLWTSGRDHIPEL